MAYINRNRYAFDLSQKVHDMYVQTFSVDIFDVVDQFKGIKLFKTSDNIILPPFEEGACCRAEDNRYGIIYNANKPINRIKFTIAHELGHILLGHLDFAKNTPDMNKELEADTFASNLLAPPRLIQYAQFNFDDFEYTPQYIAKLFNVSEACAKVRLADYEEWSKFQSYKYAEY